MSVLQSLGFGFQLHSAVPDVANPITAASANAPTGNPFTVPTGAKGILVRPSVAMVAADIGEISQEATPTKGDGLHIHGDDGLQYYAIRESDNLHLHWVAGVVTFSVNIWYVF